jgi:chemotaxis methyl-accepting protein methylase
MRPELLDDVAELVAKRSGIIFQPSSRGRLLIALTEEARLRAVRPEVLAERLRHDAEAFQSLLDRITVQETSFFRDPGQFAALASILTSIPEPVTIWSAGCANGQEAYSLAMTLAESGIRDWNVLASDISTTALSRSETARYSDREIRGLSDERRDRYLTRSGEGWDVVAPLRDRVTILRHNLVSELPPFAPGACSIVFCRNVFIYLHRDDVARFLDRVHDRMAADGFLFLGFSESLWQISERFRLQRIGDAFVYRPGGGDLTPPVLAPERSVPAPMPTLRREPVTSPDIREMLATGEAAAERLDHSAAAASFRQAAYLDPDHALAHFHLGLALEALGDDRSAQRAFRAAAAVIEAGSSETLQGGLGGFGSRDLAQVLRSKLKAALR